MRRWAIVMAGLLALAQAPTWGQAKPIEVAADAAYRHKHTGLGFPAAIGGERRDRVSEGEPDQRDVSVNYSSADGREATTFYIYPLTTGTLPIWFDRAVWAVENRPLYGGPRRLDLPAPFAPPGERVASAMAAYYAVDGGEIASTAVGIAPIGDWLVKVRISSETAPADTLPARLTAALAALTWPDQGGDEAEPAAPVPPCATPMAFADDATSVGDKSLQLQHLILSASVYQLVEKKKAGGEEAEGTPAGYCRDRASTGMSALYRRGESTDSYLLALSDAGRGVSVFQSTLSQSLGQKAEADHRPSYAVDLRGPSSTMILPMQDALPSPTRVEALLKAGVIVGSISLQGEKPSVSVNGDFAKD